MDEITKLLKLKHLLRGNPIKRGLIEDIFGDIYLANLEKKGYICKYDGYWRLLE